MGREMRIECENGDFSDAVQVHFASAFGGIVALRTRRVHANNPADSKCNA